MARVYILLLALLSFHAAFSQRGSIRVKVIDADSNEPIPFATVYFSKTTIGGYTDTNGYVEITKIPFATYELAISEVSHKAYSRSIYIRSEQPQYLTIKLLPKTLQEVTITSKRDDKWNRQYLRFRKLFFGSDHYEDCVISNPWLLEFKNVQGNFIAEASEPIKIENNYLGYNLEFRIKSCAFSATSYLIDGTVRFEEKKGSDSLLAVYKANRSYAYRGSTQHFLRTLLDSSLMRSGYHLYSDVSNTESILRAPSFLANVGKSLYPFSLKQRVRETKEGNYAIRFPMRLEVHYTPKRAKIYAYRNISYAVSWMEVKNDTLIVSGDGLVQNPKNLIVRGAMGDIRVAEWVPIDYQYTETEPEEIITDPVTVTAELLEKPYVQTDRNYYYNGETMWLKGYMSYSQPLLKDTLSQSVYIELADANGNVVVKKRYPVDQGKFEGDILIPQKLKSGPYQLKSYTAWMLNFDHRLVFTKTIDVLGDREAVKILSNYVPMADSLPNISLKTDKDSYTARDKITVKIDVFDSLAFRSPSDLSIAVTDLEQAVPLKNEKNILINYPFDGTENGDTTNRVKYNIEYGIDFSGQFFLGKNPKPVQASITVFQDNVSESFGIITEENGKFFRSMSFNDTVSFYLRSMSANNKKGVVRMNEFKLPSPARDLEPLPLDLYTTENVRQPYKDPDKVKVLQEVTIKSTKIEKPQPAVIHGKGDYTITGEWINSHNFTDILLAISAKVPGLTYDPISGAFTFRSSQFSGTAASPLMLVDNVVVNDVSQILDIPIRSIDRVDVLKFGASSAYGARAAGGVIAIYTRKGAPETPEQKGFDKSKLQEVKVYGYSTASAFKAPNYSDPAPNNNLDYRATIYWSPSITTDGKQPAMVSFYAADVATKYRIVVEGITAAGLPVRAEKIIEIVKD